jgi:dsDNA-specific endonuclease/ATPase MutS2
MLKNHRQSAKPNYTGELGDLYQQNKVIREKKPRKFVKYDKVREISGKKPGEKKKNRLPKLASAQGPGKGEVSPKPPS